MSINSTPEITLTKADILSNLNFATSGNLTHLTVQDHAGSKFQTLVENVLKNVYRNFDSKSVLSFDGVSEIKGCFFYE